MYVFFKLILNKSLPQHAATDSSLTLFIVELMVAEVLI